MSRAHPLADWHTNKWRIKTVQMKYKRAKVTSYHRSFPATPKQANSEFGFQYKIKRKTQ